MPRRGITLATVSIGAIVAVVALRAPAADPDPQDAAVDAIADREVLSYGLGFHLGREVRTGLTTDQVDADYDQVLEGFNAAIRGEAARIDEQEIDRVLFLVHAEMKRRTVERLLETDEAFKALHDANAEKSRAYLAENGRREGVITLDNGAQYEVVVAGEGASPTLESTVVINYHGRLADGTTFDRAEGVEKQVADLLEGGQSIITRMRPGSRWNVAIPPELAHGAAGEPPVIGPNEVLIFQAELVEVK